MNVYGAFVYFNVYKTHLFSRTPRNFDEYEEEDPANTKAEELSEASNAQAPKTQATNRMYEASQESNLLSSRTAQF